MTADSAIAHLIPILRNLYVGRMASGAAITLLLYDWMLVFLDEYEIFYRAEWSIPRFLLIYIRVVTPPTLMFTAFAVSDLRPALNTKICQLWIYSHTLGMFTSLCATNGLLSLRLMALYRRRRPVVWFIGIFYSLSYITAFTLIVYLLEKYHGTIYYSQEVRSCTAVWASKPVAAIFYAPMAFETFLFSLTVWSAWRDTKGMLGSSSTPFLIVFYRDGAAFFLVVTGLRAWNIWIYVTQTPDSYNMGTPLMWAITVILTTRLYMNLVQLARKPPLTVLTSGQEVGPSIDIAMQPRRNMFRSTMSHEYGHHLISTEVGTGYLNSTLDAIHVQDNPPSGIRK